MRFPGPPTSIAQLAALFAATTVLTVSCANKPRVELVAPGGRTLAIVRVEVADTGETREVGLMYRKHLDQDAGMLFVFRQPQHQTFWMKNTEMALDMIFAAADGRVIGTVENARPFSEQLLAVHGASQYVLEVSGGFCKRHGIGVGDSMKFSSFVPRARD